MAADPNPPPGQLTIFSIDPGPVNTGWVFATFDKTPGVLSLVACGISRLVQEDTVWDESSIASGTYRFWHEEHKEKLEVINGNRKEAQVLVEFQFPIWEKPQVYAYLKNKVVEVALKSHVRPDRVRSISAALVKNRYKLSTGSHSDNKKVVPIWVLKRIGPEVYARFISCSIRNPDQHHVCDALCQLIYWLEVSNNWPINTIQYESYNNSRQGSEELHPGQQGPSLETPPPSSNDVKNKRNRRVKPKTAGERSLSTLLSLGRGDKGKKSRRQSPWKP